jgi:AraC-like DNA-binding protein
MFFFMLCALTRTGGARRLLPMVLAGRVQDAASQALAALDDEPAGVEEAVLAADLLLAQDRAEEAEEAYRQSLAVAGAAPRGQLRVISCRNTGFLSLHQRRYAVAATCFQRLADDEGASLSQQVEALAGLALTQHAMGRSDMAGQALSDALARLDRAAANTDADLPSLHLFLRLVQLELSAQAMIRTHAALADHVFWQSDSAWAASRPDEAQLQSQLLQMLQGCGSHVLITQRLALLVCLLRAQGGSVRSLESVHDHLAWLRRMHLAAAERQCRMEASLVAIATHRAELARSLLEPLCTRQGEGPQRWNFELSYCRAKLCEMTGQSEECLRHYQRYALESVMCLRQEMPRPVNAATESARTGEVRDEVELALPAKYRRAYRYLLSHMERPDLSVREIAEHIGVTERAVQSAFRTHLGMTPAEVLRRNRVERIRAELLQAEGCGLNVIETAARWGIRNRSTLVSSYRKHFRETPADTLARREAAPAAAA